MTNSTTRRTIITALLARRRAQLRQEAESGPRDNAIMRLQKAIDGQRDCEARFAEVANYSNSLIGQESRDVL